MKVVIGILVVLLLMLNGWALGQGVTLTNTENGKTKLVPVGASITVYGYQDVVDDDTSKCPCPIKLDGILLENNGDSLHIELSEYELTLVSSTQSKFAKRKIEYEGVSEVFVIANSSVEALQFFKSKKVDATANVIAVTGFFGILTGTAMMTSILFTKDKEKKVKRLRNGGLVFFGGLLTGLATGRKTYDVRGKWRME